MPVATSWEPYTEKRENFDYSTGEIWTKNAFTYGKFEARIKIPKGKGFWPAFWLYGGNPVWNEIDIFEFVENNTTKHIMTNHYDYDKDGKDNMCNTNYKGKDFSQDFHIYTLIWEKDKIQWFVDGILKRTDLRYYTFLGQITDCSIDAFHEYILNKIYPTNPMALILNTAIECGLDKNNKSKLPDSSTPFPSQMEVDWVRCYTRATSPDIVPNISFYPNPNNGSLTVDFGFLEYENYSLKIVDLKGYIIYQKNTIESQKVQLSIPNKTKGLCILYLVNNKTKEIITHEIISY